MSKKTKTAVTLTLSPDIIEEAKEQARKENRSLSNYIEWLVINNTKK